MIIHLSDLHIGAGDIEAVNADILFRWISETHPSVLVLITGDLTESAEDHELEQVSTLLTRLSETNHVIVVPGNHDYAWHGNILKEGSWATWRKLVGQQFGGDTELIDGLTLTRIGDSAIFAVDSGDPRDEEISARGYISEGLAGKLKEGLVEHDGLERIVFLHHHPFSDGFFMKLHGSGILLSALAGHCETLLFGHEHHFCAWRKFKGVPLIVASHKTPDPFYEAECLMVVCVDGNKCHLEPIAIEESR